MTESSRWSQGVSCKDRTQGVNRRVSSPRCPRVGLRKERGAECWENGGCHCKWWPCYVPVSRSISRKREFSWSRTNWNERAGFASEFPCRHSLRSSSDIGGAPVGWPSGGSRAVTNPFTTTAGVAERAHRGPTWHLSATRRSRALALYDLGSSDEAATETLLLDRAEQVLYAAPVPSAMRF